MASAHRDHWLMSIRPAFVASFLKKLLRIRRRIIDTPEGRFFIDPASHFGNSLLCHPPYEPDMLRCLYSLLKPGDTFFDVGANEGYFSIIAARLVGDDGLVVCIEPQSRLQDVVTRNIAENAAFNVQLLQYAVSDTNDVATLSLLPDMNTGGSGLVRATKYSVSTQLVLQTTLSRITERFRCRAIRLMKIDVEGFEYEAIMGSKDLFMSRFVEHIALELHPALLAQRGKKQRDILEFLHHAGYAPNPQFGNHVLSTTTGPQ